jgi:hypothetical protein
VFIAEGQANQENTTEQDAEPAVCRNWKHQFPLHLI